jgi:RimJ/RimL family protein N-acetyltransferase
MAHNLRARYARRGDESCLLVWANDPEARKQSFTRKRIAAAQHHQWFREMLADPRQRCFVILKGRRKVGLVRFSRRAPQKWEIHFNMNPRWRGKGMGRAFLRAGISRFHREFPRVSLVAQVKPGNRRSLLCLAGNRFSTASQARRRTLLVSPSPR